MMPNKKISILKIFRQLQGSHLKQIAKNICNYTRGTPNQGSSSSLSEYENHKIIPLRKTIINIANALNIAPDIIFYSFGYFGDKEIEIIKNDPFYYMEKIKELCNNHDNRYGKESVNLDDLNRTRAFEYQQNYRRNNNDK